MASSSTSIAEYLFSRLYQLGIRSIFGVPGDYNLSLLDYVEPAGLHWSGTSNELNGGYATDGYARVNGLSALITTFGVGELSVVNAIAGAYAEKTPIVHIVGTPSRATQESRSLVHHTLNDGDFSHFARMQIPITAAQTDLKDPRTIPAQIDSILKQCLLESRPVYIQIPVDVVSIQVNCTNLERKISIYDDPAPTSASFQEGLDAIYSRMQASERPMILVDGETRATGIVNEVSRLIELTQWPTWTSVFGKGLVDETQHNVHGIWAGARSSQEVNDYVHSCDLILNFGPHHSSTNSSDFTAIPDANVCIFFGPNYTRLGSKIIRDIPVKHFLHELLRRLEYKSITAPPSLSFPLADGRKGNIPVDTDIVKQAHFWGIMSDFLRDGDILLGETGTAAHGTRSFRLPKGVRYVTAVTWLSIGYMLPAAFGASMALREIQGGEQKSRTVLFIGEGSLQLTVQAIGDIIRERINMIIVVINNGGYTIERCIHGRNQAYNDVGQWRYLLAPAFFGAPQQGEYVAHTYEAANWGQLKEILADPVLHEGKGLHVVEVLMDKEDAPAALLALLQEQIKAEEPSQYARLVS